MMLRKLISASLACLLIFSCTAGVLAAPPEQMDPSEAIAPEEAVDSAYTYDENGILTEYVEPIPDLTDEENAYDKLIAFYGAAGLPCDITYENFLDCFAASGLEYIEDYLVQCIDELYETYSLDKDIDSGKAQPVFSQSEQSLEETLQQAYIAVTEYSEYLGMPMMTDFETFCAQYASSGLYDVEVYRDQCKDEIYAAFLRTEEGMVPHEGMPLESESEPVENASGLSVMSTTGDDYFDTEYKVVLPDLDDAHNAYYKLVAYYEVLGYSCSITYDDFYRNFLNSDADSVEVYLGQCIETLENEYEDLNSDKSGSQAWYYNTGANLPRPAKYSKYNLLSVVKKGDLLYEKRGGFAGVLGHIAIVEGVFWSVQYSQFYIRLVEAVSTGVCRGVFDENRLAVKGDIILRPKNATDKQINDAVAFAIQQLGKPYLPHPGQNASASAAHWYCSELAWAAYFNTGLDLDYPNTAVEVLPLHIYNSQRTTQVPYSTTKPSTTFVDINHWAKNAISFMLDNGVMSGMTANTFAPDRSINRAMFVSMLYRLAGCPSISAADKTNNSYSDVTNQNSYYYHAVVWASSKGIVAGYTDGTFKPNGLVTREQCACFLYRYARFIGLNTYYSETSLNQFTDVNQVSSYALIPMKWAVTKGIMSGTTTTTLSPKTTCTRAMSAQLLKKVIDVLM